MTREDPPPLAVTPTRKALVRDVGEGRVARYGNGRSYDADGRDRTHELGLMGRAGWVELGEPGPVKTPWRLTEQGRRVRDGG